jgi:DNA-binding MarR family transcriptional regulator
MHQRAFLLQQLLEATPDHRLGKGPANRRLPSSVRKQLGLSPATANRVRDTLAEQGHIRVTKGREVIYELTDQGREYLQTLEQPARQQARVGATTIPEAVQKYAQPYLLFQVLTAKRTPLGRTEANRKLRGFPRDDLKLTATTANQVRGKLIAAGLLEVTKAGREETYTVTPAGLAYLAAHEQYPAGEYTFHGDVLNRLLKAASGTTPLQPSRPAAAAYAPRPTDLAQAAYTEFEELLRERYGHTGLVPIHEVRERMASKYGAAAARHEALDEPIKELWRQGRVRLISLTDLQKATDEQLNASIPGVNETLFYLERAHA